MKKWILISSISLASSLLPETKIGFSIKKFLMEINYIFLLLGNKVRKRFFCQVLHDVVQALCDCVQNWASTTQMFFFFARPPTYFQIKVTWNWWEECFKKTLQTLLCNYAIIIFFHSLLCRKERLNVRKSVRSASSFSAFFSVSKRLKSHDKRPILGCIGFHSCEEVRWWESFGPFLVLELLVSILHTIPKMDSWRLREASFTTTFFW